MNKSIISSNFPQEVSVNTRSGPKTYILEAELGEGAYNTAYLVSEKETPQKKFVYKRYKVGQEDKNHEVRILSMIHLRDSDAPIVRVVEESVIDSDEKRGHAEGFALGKKLSINKPSIRQGLRLAIYFAKLLKTCAETDIAYRDVKPFDHVFWEAEGDDGVKNMTVIDWNISRSSASVGDIYFDLVEFCRCLPEFFLGDRPSSGRRYYHPLSWHLDEKVQKTISSDIWVLLASISFNFSCPSLPNGEKLLEIGSLTKEDVIKTWYHIIDLLNRLLKVLEEGHPQKSLVEDFDDEFSSIILKWLDDPKTIQPEIWIKENVYSWLGKYDIEYPAKHLIDEKNGVLARLRVAHILSKGSFRETIAFSLFLAIYRTSLYLDNTASRIYEKILKGLMNDLPAAEIYNKEDFSTLSSLARKQITRNDNDLNTLAGQIWENLDTEFNSWLLCDKYERSTNFKEKQYILEDLDPLHPCYLKYKKDFNTQKDRQDQLLEIESNIEAGQFSNAERIARKLDASDSTSSEELILFCKQLYAIKDLKENELNLEEVVGIINSSPAKELPYTYQVQFNKLKNNLPKIRDNAAIKFKKKYEQLLEDFNQPGKIKEIMELLDRPENNRFLEEDWLKNEQEKVRTLFTAVNILEEMNQFRRKEWSVANTLSKLEGYKEGRDLFERLSSFQIENDLRQKTYNLLNQAHQTQVDNYSSIKVELEVMKKDTHNNGLPSLIDTVDLNQQKNDKIFQRLERNQNRLNMVVISGTIIFSLLVILLLAFPVLNFFNVEFYNNVTATPSVSPPNSSAQAPFESGQTSTPAFIPTATYTSEPTTEPELYAYLVTNAVFLGDDSTTKLWLFSNPSGFDTVMVEIIEKTEIYSLVRINSVVGVQLIDPSTSMIKNKVNIRINDEATNYPVIGYSSSSFVVETTGNLINEIYQPVIIQGWVENNFLVEKQP